MERRIERNAVLVDEHPLWLDAVETLLRAVGVEVVGKTTDPDEAVRLVAALRPTLLVAEIEFPHSGSDGLAILRRARQEVPGIRAIVLAGRDDASVIANALATGAMGYVVKTAHPDDLAAAVRQAFDQSLYFAAGPANGSASPMPPADLPLTRRETEILALVADGRSNAQLARELWVTEQTVKFHLSNIYRKLNVSNRTEASRWAQRHGVLPPDLPVPSEEETTSTPSPDALGVTTRA